MEIDQSSSSPVAPSTKVVLSFGEDAVSLPMEQASNVEVASAHKDNQIHAADAGHGDEGQATHHMRQTCVVPQIGMAFDTEDSAYDMYNKYAGEIGFSIRKSTTRYRPDGSIYQKHLVCSSEGFAKSESNKGVTRTGCGARIQFSVDKQGIWIVQKVLLEHNHYLASPNKKRNLRSQRQVTEADRKLIGQIREAGMKPAQVYEFMKEFYGGADKVPSVVKGPKNKRSTIFLGKRKGKKKKSVSDKDTVAEDPDGTLRSRVRDDDNPQQMTDVIAGTTDASTTDMYGQSSSMSIPSVHFGEYTSLLLGLDQDVATTVRKLHFDGPPNDNI